MTKQIEMLENLEFSDDLKGKHISTDALQEEYDYDTDLGSEEERELVPSFRNLTHDEIYLRSCEKFGVVPISCFMSLMRNDIIDLSHRGLGPNGARAIAEPLVANTSVLELNLEDNWIQAEGMQDVAQMLMENCYIAVLNISENKLASDGARYVCEMLVENTTLRELNVSRNDFKDGDGQYFAEALKQNLRLQELNLSGNAFCEIGGKWLGQAIALNEGIEFLNLSWNHLRLKGALAVCAGMKSNITIKSLDLSWNGFADEGARAMGEALKTNDTLTWLDLSHNRITEKGAAKLAKGLEMNKTLKTLKIGENPIREEGALALLQAIVKNDRSAIEELDLKGVRVSNEFLELAELLRKRISSASGGEMSFSFITNRYDRSSGWKDRARASEEQDLMMILQNFLQEKRLRLIDLFKAFDKDVSWKISQEEFKKGIMNAGIPLTAKQLKTLLRKLDKDTDGQVDYRELLIGRKGALLRRREILRKEAKEKARKKEEAEKFMSVWQEAVRDTASPTNSFSLSPNHTPLRSRSLVVPQQDKTAATIQELHAGNTLRGNNYRYSSQSTTSLEGEEKSSLLDVAPQSSLQSKSMVNLHSSNMSYLQSNLFGLSIPVPSKQTSN